MASPGAAALRRYANVRKSALSNKLEFGYMLQESVPPITLFDFSRKDDILDFENKEWREGDDGDIGGFSSAKAEIIHTKVEGDEVTSFLRWKGNLNNTIPDSGKVVRSGYCAIQSPLFPFGGVDLNEWDAILLKCRLSQPRTYMLNIKAETFIPEDLYHGIFPRENPAIHPLKPSNKATPGEWMSYILPFDTFLVSNRGRSKEVPQKMDSVKVENVGFTIADGVEGDFQLDVASISAICLDDDYEDFRIESRPFP